VSAANEEQARGIDEISLSVRQMEQVTQSAASNAEQNAQATDKVRGEATSLDGIVQRLRFMMGYPGPRAGSVTIEECLR
jgi:methyl-accepting chemotaxis protein